jgi:multicomponent K+:H+ antiporter subunit A
MSTPTLPLALILASPFLGALVLGLYGAHSGQTDEAARLRSAGWLAGLFTAIAAIALGSLAPSILDGQVHRAGVAWLPVFGVQFGLRLDGLALIFAGLILGIGLLVVLYARYYLSPRDRTVWFYVLLLAFMGAMLGVALADNLILLAMAWELTSLTSFLLIGFWNQRRDARQGARMALTVTGAGGLALMGGLLLLGSIAGSWQLDEVLSAGPVVRAHPLYPLCLALILLGAVTKSAQFPFHFWLPHAMAAPTPVSAYLHSATMVKAGIFLLARLYPTLAGSDEWFYAVTCIGAATLLVGAWHAIFQHDLKGLLAYSTISHLGLIVMLLGLGTPMAAVAALFHLLNHAAFKASLFMAAGIIDHETGTRDMRRLRGLSGPMPVTATAAIVAAAAMAGVPLFNGFLSKEMFLAEALAVDSAPLVRVLVVGAAIIATSLSVAYSARFVHDVFFGGPPAEPLPRSPHEPPHWMRVPIELLALLCLAVGLFPSVVVGPLLSAGARTLLGDRVPEYSLAIWHGLSLPLALSGLALAGGTALYFALQRGSRRKLHERAENSGAGKRGFERAIQGLVGLAARMDRTLHAGGIRRSLALTVLAACVALVLPWTQAGLPAIQSGSSMNVNEASTVAWAVWAIAMAAALGTVLLSGQRLLALLSLGAVGLVLALSFVTFSAPDLALTQLLVEMVSFLLMMLALRYLPGSPAEAMHGGTTSRDTTARRLRDAGLAGLAGLSLGTLAWAVMTRPFSTLSDHYLARTVNEAGGANAVNVVIVDFRGYDTLGETMVMAVAGLIVHALLAQRQLPEVWGPARTGLSTRAEARLPLMLSTVARTLLPFALMVSVYLFLRGHNLPGGGFIAGLVTAIALLLQAVAGTQRSDDDAPAADAEAAARGETRSSARWHVVIGMGVLLTVLTGLGSWVFGYPFLTSTFGHPHLPVIGELPLASAAAFDLGVYLSVVGATVLALASLGLVGRPASPTEQVS